MYPPAYLSIIIRVPCAASTPRAPVRRRRVAFQALPPESSFADRDTQKGKTRFVGCGSRWRPVGPSRRACVAADSCQEQRLFPRFVLISGAVAFLTVVLLLVSLWKLRR